LFVKILTTFPSHEAASELLNQSASDVKCSRVLCAIRSCIVSRRLQSSIACDNVCICRNMKTVGDAEVMQHCCCNKYLAGFLWSIEECSTRFVETPEPGLEYPEATLDYVTRFCMCQVVGVVWWSWWRWNGCH